MRLALWGLVLTATSAVAQAVLDDPVKIADAQKHLDASQFKPLRCEVFPTEPRFGFSLRLQTGYIYRVPLNRYRGAGHKWAVLTRVTPRDDGQHPVYLADTVQLPPVPDTNLEGEFGGSWFLGEGRYTVKWLLFDDSGRACRKEWRVDARLSSGQRKVKPLMAPNTVAGLAWRGTAAGEPANSAPFSRLTVLLDAAPMAPQKTVLGASDKGLLLNALAALVEELPARSVKLLAFHAGLQKEVFRREGFTIEDMPEVARALNELQPGVIDYSVLQNPEGALELIERLANLETRAWQPSDAVVFMGPRTRYTGKIPPGIVDQPRGPAPRFFYLLLSPSAAPFGARPDAIQDIVALLKGKTMVAGFPEDFAKAIAEVKRLMATRQ